jgi:hypothetical protein
MNEKENKNIFNLLIGIGNMVYNNDTNKSLAKDMDIGATIKDLSLAVVDEHVNNITQLKNYLVNILK